MSLEGFHDNTQELQDKNENVLEKKYTLESGNTIVLNIKQIFPESFEYDNQNNALVFLPGWEVGTDDPTTKALAGTFAEASHKKTFAITSTIEQSNDVEVDSLYEEAGAIARFLGDQKCADVTIVGYSIGGDKAINLVSILERQKNIKVKGLVLLASTGLYEEKPHAMVTHLTQDSFVRTPKALLKNEHTGNNLKTWFRVAKDVGVSMVGSAVSQKGYLKKMRTNIKAVSDVNPHTHDITVPVVLVNGADDIVSNHKKILDGNEREQLKGENREIFLKEKIFSKSPYVKMVIPEKTSNHGLPYFRSRSVAEVSLFLIDRFYKNVSNKGIYPNEPQ